MSSTGRCLMILSLYNREYGLQLDRSYNEYRVAHKNVPNFAMMLYCLTVEFKRKEITFLKSNNS